MTEQFLQILNTSISASWLVLAVIALRFVLKKAPKWVDVLLWGLVAFRLLCPFTLESALSLIPSTQVVSPEIMTDPAPTIHTGIESINSVVNPIITETFAPEPVASANPLQIWLPVLSGIWCAGIAAMLLYTVVSYTRLRHRVRMAIRVKKDIYLSEFVTSPFVLGIFKPRIYLPYHMSKPDRSHVIAHERTHIRRKDHWWKPLGFLLLTIHWFNPLMWLAYILLCRDIELACDERVIRELGTDQRADYSQALLHCSVTHRSIAACPIAFGEVGVKQRVKNVLSYKKPAFWVILISLLLVVIVAVCFLTDPLPDEGNPYLLIHRVIDQDGYTITNQEDQNINLVIETKHLTEDCYTETGHTFKINEVVPYHTYSDNSLYLEHIGINPEAPDYLRFTFDFHTEQLQRETLLLPYHFDIVDGITKGYIGNVSVKQEEVWDNSQVYPNAAYYEVVQNGYGFCVNILADICRNADHHVAFMMEHFNRVTYEEMTNEWPITMTLQDVFRTRGYLTFYYDGSLSDNGFQISEDYTLEQLTDGNWKELPTLHEPQELSPVVEVDSPNYDAWNSLNWEEVYGRLQDGTYRIKKDITFTNDSGNTETRPYYAEFTIGGTAEDYITLQLEDITPTGATLYIQENVEDTMDLIYAGEEGYWLESWQDGQWVYLKPTGYVEPLFADETRYIGGLHYSSTHIELDWKHLHGELPSGAYRIAREVTYIGGKDPIVCTVYKEFAIGNDWGIDLFLDRITENGITLSFLLDDNLQTGEYFLAGHTLQVRERMGNWTDVISMSKTSGGPDIVTEAPSFSFLWDDDMYHLTEGEHRVGICIKHVLPDGTEEFNTIYEYFDPAAYAWGIAMDVTGISGRPADLKINYDTTFPSTLSAGSLTEYPYYRLQKRENNQWVEVEPRTPYSYFAQYEHQAVRPGSERNTQINLSGSYNRLTTGTYRLVQEYTRHYSDGTTDIRPVYAVFVIDN